MCVRVCVPVCARVCLCVRSMSYLAVFTQDVGRSTFPIISFKALSHTIIQFSLVDNDHVILIWQVDYAASHTGLLMQEGEGSAYCALLQAWLGRLWEIAFLEDCSATRVSHQQFLHFHPGSILGLLCLPDSHTHTHLCNSALRFSAQELC